MKKLEGRVALVMGAEDAEALAERIRGKTLGRQRRSMRISAILPRAKAFVDAAVQELGRLDILVNSAGGKPI